LKAKSLIDLWTEKAKIAVGRPFDAKNDILNTSLDIITAVSFGLHDEDGITRRQLDAVLANPQEYATLPGEIDDMVEFLQIPLSKEFQAILTLTKSTAVNFSSPFPMWHHWLLHKLPSMKEARRIKEEMTRREIDKAASKYMTQTVSEHQQVTQSALEYMISRELAAAKKAGREPYLHSRVIYDEVCVTNNSTGHKLNFLAY
jgi:hypothetical protein